RSADAMWMREVRPHPCNRRYRISRMTTSVHRGAPRRILVLNERDPRSPMTGGAETHIFEIFRRLVARGHEVTVLAASFPGAAREEVVEGVRVCRLANRYLY